MQMARSRALNQRFQLFLPPPEDPAAIHSALTQVIEALAADMIEPSRARALISGLRLCLQSLKKKDSWHDSAYHCDEPVDYENFEADYGLPKDIDINRSPEEVFPPSKKMKWVPHPDRALRARGWAFQRRCPTTANWQLTIPKILPPKPSTSSTSAAASLPPTKTSLVSASA